MGNYLLTEDACLYKCSVDEVRVATRFTNCSLLDYLKSND